MRKRSELPQNGEKRVSHETVDQLRVTTPAIEATAAKVHGAAELSAGDVVRYTHGRETFSPVQYHAFDVGPIAVETRVREGETAEDAYLRAYKFAVTAFEAEFSLKLGLFKQRVERTKDEVRGRR